MGNILGRMSLQIYYERKHCCFLPKYMGRMSTRAAPVAAPVTQYRDLCQISSPVRYRRNKTKQESYTYLCSYVGCIHCLLFQLLPFTCLWYIPV